MPGLLFSRIHLKTNTLLFIVWRPTKSETWPDSLVNCFTWMLYHGTAWNAFTSMRKKQIHPGERENRISFIFIRVFFFATYYSRIFIKILLQELAEFMGLPKLKEKLRPFKTQTNARFVTNFFTAIGLGGLA